MNESFLENFPIFKVGDEVFCLKTGKVFIIKNFQQASNNTVKVHGKMWSKLRFDDPELFYEEEYFNRS